MRVRVLLFGPQAQAAGKEAVEVELSVGAEPPTAGAVLSRLAETEPSLRATIGASRLAVNHRFARPEQVVGESDELALIGLVAGG